MLQYFDAAKKIAHLAIKYKHSLGEEVIIRNAISLNLLHSLSLSLFLSSGIVLCVI